MTDGPGAAFFFKIQRGLINRLSRTGEFGGVPYGGHRLGWASEPTGVEGRSAR
jgi:hypothetical protein